MSIAENRQASFPTSKIAIITLAKSAPGMVLPVVLSSHVTDQFCGL